jgi:hypothetical protein
MKIHLEIWGMMPNAQNGKYQGYSQKMSIKKELYNKYNINYKEIFPDIFTGKYFSIQENLISFFKEILELDLKFVVQEKLISSRQLTDEQLLLEILKFSKDNYIFPTFAEMKRNGGEYLYQSVLKRYNNIQEFANKYGKISKSTPQGYWTKERLLNELKDMIERYGYVLRGNNLKKTNSKLYSATNKVGIINLKLELFKNFPEYITKIEKEWLYKFIYSPYRSNIDKAYVVQKEIALELYNKLIA